MIAARQAASRRQAATWSYGGADGGTVRGRRRQCRGCPNGGTGAAADAERERGRRSRPTAGRAGAHRGDARAQPAGWRHRRPAQEDARMSTEEIGKRIDRARQALEQARPLYDEALSWLSPERVGAHQKKAPGQAAPARIWDSTPAVSLLRATNRMISDYVPPTQPWFEIGLSSLARDLGEEQFRSLLGRSKDEVERELELVTNIARSVFAGPGFATAAHEMFIHWHVGQGAMLVDLNPDDNVGPVRFRAVPLGTWWAEEGAGGELDRWYWWFRLRASAIEQEWRDAQLPEELRKLISADGDHDVDLVMAAWRGDTPTGRSYQVGVFWQGSAGYHRLVTRRQRTSPFVTPRHTKLPGEAMGRGPALFALPDIRTANKIVEMTLQAAALAIGGLWMAEEGTFRAPLKIAPGAVVMVSRMNGLQPLPTAQRLDFSQIILEKLHENIKKTLGDHSLPPEAGPIRSATEFVQRARELVDDKAGGLARLHAEFVVPVVRRVLDLLDSWGRLPMSMPVVDQFLIEVRATSPLARGGALMEVENVVRFIDLLKAIGGDALMGYEMDIDRTTEWLGDRLMVPEAIRNTEQVKQQAKAAMAQAAQAQAQAGAPAGDQASPQVVNLNA
ncbi:MAG: hypothetical protein D6811_01530 [Alphaproteobacteria bacterium]|nr:MAG: hypothetical protein D6811_01530 [Alphaproteobacteria bacterium]